MFYNYLIDSMAEGYQAAQQNAEKVCKDSIVKVDHPMHIVLFIVNIFIPGLGTVISAFMDKKNKDFNKAALAFGILQFMFAWTIVCWLWSIVHGFLIFTKSS